tara:strand:- start:11772 stop:12398 length:627 start_codon:yes stop_codon:yes gene_type:complete
MSDVASKRPVMTLFSSSDDAYSQQVRMVLAEKACTVDIIEVDPKNPPEDLLDVNPYNTLPTLIERDLVLYESNIIMEYLDERFPHPPLLPVYPIARAKSRLLMHRMKLDWYSLMETIETGSEVDAAQARKHLQETLTELAPVFGQMPYFMSEEFSLVDCYLLPLLWRLPKLGVVLPDSAKEVTDYAKRLFERPCFVASLTEKERQMRG